MKGEKKCKAELNCCVRGTEAVELLQQAVEVYTDGGRFSMAAKVQKDVAEMLEAEMVSVPPCPQCVLLRPCGV